uniref:UDP-glucose 4-epimerase n=1 Tax=Ditylenchus dipsaci TaxID=166011 RepID=A0A915DA84_9BILA
MNLLKMCQKYNVKEFVFASSATVYGSVDQTSPIKENEQTGLLITNPYGHSKHMLEQLITDFCASYSDFYATILRMFDPAGAHPSGLLGEDNTTKCPKHLMPYIALVASGKKSHLNVFGDKFPTRDGTGVRDFVHIMDVVKAHVASLERMHDLRAKNKTGRAEIFNIGSGKGSTVLEMVKAFEKASNKKINYQIMDPRPGDIASIVSDLTAAQKKLKWTPKLSIDNMCRDIWNWQINNSNGYE